MAADLSTTANTRTRLIVHHALHGYSGGHRLLESSLSLSAAAERQMDILSDLSGSTPPSGFEEYLTIYPIVGMEAMAFARTWLAKEMPRPGCVWTHTLFLDFAALETLTQLAFLTTHFSRPDKKEGFHNYSEPLSVPIDEPLSYPEPDLDSPLALGLVRCWYSETDRRPLVIPAESSRRFERLVLALWEQQIPELRKSIAISTGSITDRRIAGRSFDVQVVPRQSTREVLRQCRGVNVEDTRTFDEGESSSASGFEVLTSDIQNPSAEFRKFLRESADRSVRPCDIPILSGAFSIWFGPTSSASKVRMLWNLIAASFPKKDQGTNLKAMFFGNAIGMLKGEEEQLVLQAVLLAEQPVEFLDVATLRVPERCAALAISDLTAAIDLLESVSRSHRPSEILVQSFNSLLDVIPQDALIEFLERNRPLLRQVVGLRPGLIENPKLWHQFGDSPHDIVVAVATAEKFSSSLAASLLGVLLSPQGSHLADTFADRCTNSNLVTLIHVALNTAGTPSELFELFLRRRMQGVVESCSTQRALPATFMVAVSKVVLPRWPGNSEFPCAAWATSLRETECLQANERIRVCAFSVAMALSWEANESVDFLRSCFSPVYLEAKANRIDYPSWALLDPLVPSLWGWGNWDKCERLRRAILEGITQGRWHPVILLDISADAETLSSFITTAEERNHQSIFPQLLQNMDRHASYLSERERLAIRRKLSN